MDVRAEDRSSPWPHDSSGGGWSVDAPAGGTHDARPTERMATWSLVCSIIGIVAGFAAVAGIVLGFKARARIVRAEGKLKGERLALAGIIVGFGALTLLTGLVLVAALAPPSGNQSPDAALAQRELIPASGYPRGFTGQGPGTDVGDASYFAGTGLQEAKCLGMPDSHVDTHPVEAGGQEYIRGNVWVNDTVDVFPTAADARVDETASANPNALSCQFWSWGPGLDQDIAPDLGPGEHDKPPIALGVSEIGRHVSNEMWSMSYTYRGKAGISYNDWVTVGRDRAESNIWITSLGTPIRSNLIERLVKAADGQMASN